MKKCKVCGVMLDDQTDYCPQCGYCFTSGKTAEEQALSGSRLSYTVSCFNVFLIHRSICRVLLFDFARAFDGIFGPMSTYS